MTAALLVSEAELILCLAGAGIGLVAGALLQRTHWCTMGAVADWTLFGSTRRLRAWGLAIAIAMVGAALLDATRVVPLAESAYLSPSLPVLALAAGGFAFGFGMVLAGGCVSRSLARAGSGSLRALLVLFVVAVAAQATTSGILALPAELLRSVAIATTTPGLAEALAAVFGFPLPATRLVLSLGLALALLVWVFSHPGLRRPSAELKAGVGLGLLIVAGWAASGLAALDPFADIRPASLSYVGPTARALLWLLAGGGTLPSFGAALVFGTLIGAFLIARADGAFRVESFVDAADLRRHLAGGLLMGIGGALALGCTVGQGLSGLSTLSFGSLLAVGGIVLGARQALRFLERGRLLPHLPVWLGALRVGVRVRSGDSTR